MSNKNKEKQDCINSGGQWKDPPGECEYPFELTSKTVTDAEAENEKQEREARDEQLVDSPVASQEPKQ